MTGSADEELEKFARELWETTMNIARSFKLMQRKRQGEELTPPQFLLLKEVCAGEGITMSELAKRLRVSRGVATRMVDLLLERNLLQRKRDPRDRRVVTVYPTRRGRKVFHDTREDIIAHMKTTLRHLSPADRSRLLDLFRYINAGMQEEENAEGRGIPGKDAEANGG